MDVDGTFYNQTKLRRAMLLRLVSAHARRPRQLISAARMIRCYRKAQEDLRRRDARAVAIGEEQLAIACRRARVSVTTGRDCIKTWMESEPLAILPRFTYSGLIEFLTACTSLGLRLGVFSDYPAEAKLHAMGLSSFFHVVATAQDPAINAFKPDPRGILAVARRLGVEPRQAVYIGDRPDVDAHAAHAAGMNCFILQPAQSQAAQSYNTFSSYRELIQTLSSRPAEVAL